jgi:hypothetical protein
MISKLQKHPSAAKADKSSVSMCGTAEAMPFQNDDPIDLKMHGPPGRLR